MCVGSGESVTGEWYRSPLFVPPTFSSSWLPLPSVGFLSLQPGHMQVMATLRRFMANYSRINQSGTWGPVSGLSCVTAHTPGAFLVGDAVGEKPPD